jgi:hypothetical protein
MGVCTDWSAFVIVLSFYRPNIPLISVAYKAVCELPKNLFSVDIPGGCSQYPLLSAATHGPLPGPGSATVSAYVMYVWGDLCAKGRLLLTLAEGEACRGCESYEHLALRLAPRSWLSSLHLVECRTCWIKSDCDDTHGMLLLVDGLDCHQVSRERFRRAFTCLI